MVLARNLTWIHQNPTPCMGYTVLSPSKSNTMHGLYSTESIKMQHHAWAIQYWVHQNPTPCMGYTVLSSSKSNTMHGLYSTEYIKMQHNQLLEFDGFGVVGVNTLELPPSPSKSTPWFCLILVDSVLYMYSPANRTKCEPNQYQIHQTPPAAFVGFRTVYSQAMDTCICHYANSIKIQQSVYLFTACWWIWEDLDGS